MPRLQQPPGRIPCHARRMVDDSRQALVGRVVLDDRVIAARIEVAGEAIHAVHEDAEGADGPYLSPGFVDVHVHGWGGHDAMGDEAALGGMAQALLRHGVTSFLPAAVTSPLERLAAFADRVRRWIPTAPDDGAQPLGFNIEGPCISPEKKGAQNEAFIQPPSAVDRSVLEPMLEGLRIMTVAPEREGALELIGWLTAAGVNVSLGHSNATTEEADRGYATGGRTTTHLFNAMSGVDNHRPGLAVAALTNDEVYVELIADGLHVERSVWPIILRAKPPGRLILVSDAIGLAGTGEGRMRIGELEVEIRDGACRLVSDGRLAGSVIALDTAVRNVVASGVSLPLAVRAASRNPLELLGVSDRGRIATGQRADIVELDDQLNVLRVMRAGRWHAVADSVGVRQ
jgi:N-acetylglucosamine-6-phosphate deacetylase